jgi:hypothetical protein
MVDQHPVNVMLWTSQRQSLPDLPLGTLVTVRGICRITPTGFWGRPVLFRLEMRQPTDLQVMARPSWWTVTHLLYVLGALLVVALLIMAWAVVLRGRVTMQADRRSTRRCRSSSCWRISARRWERWCRRCSVPASC